MNTYVLGLHEIDRSQIAAVGGKAANLGELAAIAGLQVPDGFCVTTAAYRRLTDDDRRLEHLLGRLALLTRAELRTIAELSAKIRDTIEAIPIPREIATEIAAHLSKLGGENAFAIRSSATAEDLPGASFAGQQDTYLNILGADAIVSHIRKCWASLFTERAVVYRLQNGFDHRKVELAVVVQKMVFPQSAGILFTADPLTANRKVVSIDASFGLGEAMVSGLVNADNYRVRDGAVIEKRIATKKLAIHAAQGGGTRSQAIEPDSQNRPALTDDQIVQLERLGRTIELHFGCPQDVEWCFANGTLHVLQSRPITTLFPIPTANDRKNHVYVSVGHQQMMTDAFKPLGLSFRLLLNSAGMSVAGGRMFVDITDRLASPASRGPVIEVLGKSDPLIKDALLNIVAREGFIQQIDDNVRSSPAAGGHVWPPHAQVEPDASVAADLIKSSQTTIATLNRTIEEKSGPALFDFILEDIARLRQTLFEPRSMGVIMAAMNAASWLNEKMSDWLGEKNAADTISQSVPNNVTSEMGLALLDVADAIRPYPAVIEQLQSAKDDRVLDALLHLDGGAETRAAIDAFLDKYGMRCVGEIDITRPRWSEAPATLLPLILSNIKNFEPGASRRKFDRGLQQATSKEQELLARLKQLPDGEQKSFETKKKIDLVRNLSGYREYPKYAMVSHYFAYKQALLKEAERLVQARVLSEKEDIDYLSFEELRQVVVTGKLDHQLVRGRKDEFKLFEKLTPPRVMTSDGEIVTGQYQRENLPQSAIVGLAVSSGITEGRARVILRMEDANIEDGDILVTPFTDPSWTPLFVAIQGLVTEVGGLMTHGAVIAREYGLPAVVGVENATKLIHDGQRIRVNGTDGYVELLSDGATPTA